MKFSQVERHSSNKKARSTWERKAVGSHRANADAGTAEYFSQIRTSMKHHSYLKYFSIKL